MFLEGKKRRQQRIRKKVKGYENKPRLCVFKSNHGIYAQLIDDDKKITIAASSDIKSKNRGTMEGAKETGLDLAKKALKKEVKDVVFDRAGYKYHGKVKMLAEGAREGGLIF